MPIDPAHPGLSRRTITLGAAWAAPAVVVASAAPAYAGGSARPMVATSMPSGTAGGGGLTVTTTFTNNGTVAATSLSAAFTLTPIPPLGGTLPPTINNVTPGWTASSPQSLPNGAIQVTFTRAAGIGVGAPEAQTLSFRVPISNPGAGGIVADPPTTTPAGTNTGNAGSYA